MLGDSRCWKRRTKFLGLSTIYFVTFWTSADGGVSRFSISVVGISKKPRHRKRYMLFTALFAIIFHRELFQPTSFQIEWLKCFGLITSLQINVWAFDLLMVKVEGRWKYFWFMFQVQNIHRHSSRGDSLHCTENEASFSTIIKRRAMKIWQNMPKLSFQGRWYRLNGGIDFSNETFCPWMIRLTRGKGNMACNF